MTTSLTSETLHRELLRHALAGQFTEQDALLWMILFHTHEIRLQPSVMADANGVPGLFAALTQRHAAAVVADTWAALHDRDDKRANYVYWYRRFNSETPYEVLEDVPDTLRSRLIELRDRLARDPRVAAVVPED